MTLASLNAIRRRFGDLEVLDGAGLQVDEGERIGVIGDNGSGKTTLIRILAGVDEPDGGSVQRRKNLRIAYGAQIPELEPGVTVAEFVERGDGGFDALEARIRQLEADLAARPDDERVLREYGELQGAFEAGGGYDRHHLCERVLTGLGFDAEGIAKDVTVLSGGERSRTVLASLMTAPAELLILDEPTNHLDLDDIAFVEDFVQRYSGAVVVISHDRRFLDAVATRIVEVESGTTSSFKGNWSAFRTQKDQQLLTEARAYAKQQAFVDKEMDYIRRNMGSRMTQQAKGRLKKLQRLERISRPKGEKSRMRLDLGGGVRGRAGQTMLEALDLSVRIADRTLVDRTTFRIQHGEVVGLVGRNGAGKSTLMHVLAGERPAAGGEIKKAHALRIAVFHQEVTDLPSHLTVLDALRDVDLEATERELREHLALFLFSGIEVEAPVAGLSGGEKQRLSLARLTRGRFDMLCLDEPTNHLDIAGREGLAEALGAFPGTVLLITHDREVLAECCDRVLLLDGGQVRSFDGGLDECMATVTAERQARRQAEQAAKAAAREREERVAPPPAKATGPSAPKIRNPMKFQELEERIMQLEEQIEDVRAAMTTEAVFLDPARLQAEQAREAELQRELDAAYESWENWN